MPIRGGVWAGYIGSTVYPPTPQSKNIYQRKSIRKVSSQSVCQYCINITTPPHQAGYATLFRLKILD